MLTIAFNVVTILIVLYIFGLSVRDREVGELKRKMEEEDPYVTATEVAEAASKDPLVVSRAYFLRDSHPGRRMTGCMVFPMKKPNMKATNITTYAVLSRFEKRSIFS